MYSPSKSLTAVIHHSPFELSTTSWQAYRRPIRPLPVVAKLLLQFLWRTLLVGVVLVILAVVFVVHLLRVLLRVMLGTLAIVEVLAFGLGKLINLGASKAS